MRISLRSMTSFILNFLLGLTLLSSLSFAQLSEEGQQVRSLLRDIMQVALLPSHQQAERFRHVIAQHPELVKWMTESRRLTDLVDEAQLGEFDVIIERANGVQKYLAILYSIKDNLPFLNKGLKFWTDLSTEARYQLLRTVPAPVFKGLVALVRKNVSSAPISAQHPSFVEMRRANYGKLQPLMDTLQVVFPAYAALLPLDRKIAIVADFLKLQGPSTLAQSIEILLQNSGPGLQKLFQLLEKEVDVEAIRQAAKKILDQVRPFPNEVAFEIFERVYHKSFHKEFELLQQEPIAAGTMGQAYLVRHRKTGKEAVMKVLRPNIRHNLTEDVDRFKMLLAGNAVAQTALDTAFEALVTETELDAEGHHISEGQFYRNERTGIDAIRVFDRNLYRPKSDILIMTRAKGVPLENFIHDETTTVEQRVWALKRVHSLLYTFMKEALYGKTGAFHADIHGKNSFYDKDSKTLTLIDFGNFQRLTQTMQRGFIRMSIAADVNDIELMLEALLSMVDVHPKTLKKVKSALEQVDFASLPVMDTMEKFIEICVVKGVALPQEFLNFNRGRLFLEGHLRELIASIPKSQRPFYIKRFNPIVMYKSLGTLENIKAQASDWFFWRSDSVLKSWDLLHYAYYKAIQIAKDSPRLIAKGAKTLYVKATQDAPRSVKSAAEHTYERAEMCFYYSLNELGAFPSKRAQSNPAE